MNLKNKRHKLISLVLILTMVFTTGVPAFASTEGATENQSTAPSVATNDTDNSSSDSQNQSESNKLNQEATEESKAENNAENSNENINAASLEDNEDEGTSTKAKLGSGITFQYCKTMDQSTSARTRSSIKYTLDFVDENGNKTSAPSGVKASDITFSGSSVKISASTFDSLTVPGFTFDDAYAYFYWYGDYKGDKNDVTEFKNFGQISDNYPNYNSYIGFKSNAVSANDYTKSFPSERGYCAYNPTGTLVVVFKKASKTNPYKTNYISMNSTISTNKDTESKWEDRQWVWKPVNKLTEYTKAYMEKNYSPGDDYEFEGWCTSKDANGNGTGTVIDSTYFDEYVNTDINLYAKWTKKKISYSVNYYLNGTTTKVADSVTGTGSIGDTVTGTLKNISGYTPVDPKTTTKEIKLSKNTTEINFYYYKNVKLTANCATEDYNGTEQSVNGYTTNAGEDVDFDVTVGTKGTNAGTYTVDASSANGLVDKSGKYKVTETENGSLIINKIQISIKTDSDSKEYDGEPLTAKGSVTGVCAADKDKYSFEVTGKQTEVGSSDNTYTFKFNDETTASNYNLQESIGKLTVTKKKVDTIAVSVNDVTETYDGGAHGSKVVVNGLPDGWTYENATTKETATHVSDGEVKATCSDITIKNDKGNVVYKKVNGEVTINNLDGDEAVKFTTGTITITPATLTVITPSAEKDYDGSALTADGTCTGFVNNETATFKTTGSQLNVGTSDNTYTLKFDKTACESDYTVNKTIGKLTVNKCQITVTAKKASKVYGEADPKFDVEISGNVAAGDEIQYEVSRPGVGTDENVGTYTDAIVPTGNETQCNGNYQVKYVKADFTITESDKLTVNAEDNSKTYDGAKLESKAVNVNVTKGTTIWYKVGDGDWTKEAPSITNVKESCTVKVEARNSNYKTAKTEYKLTVKAKDVTVAAVESSKVYGANDPTFKATVTGTVTGDQDKIKYQISRPGVGTDENVATYKDAIKVTGDKIQCDGNYTVTYVPANFIITKSGTLNVSGTDYTGTYDAQKHGIAATTNITEGTKISYSIDNGKNWTDKYPTVTDVKDSCTVKVKAENPNYETATSEYNLTVNAKKVTVTANNAYKTYGDKDPKFDATVTGTYNSDKIEYTVSRTNKDEDANKYQGVIAPTGEKNQGNYTVEYKNGDFTIYKASGMTVSGTDYTGVYDGKTYGAAASASVKAGTTIYYSVNDAKETTNVPTVTDVNDSCTVKVKATNPNYEDATATYTLKVTKASIAVLETDEATWDGETHTLTLGQREDNNYGQVSGETFILKGATIEGTAVGDYTEITKSSDYELKVEKANGADSTANYDISINGKLTIKPASPMDLLELDTSACGYEGVYDGTTHGEAAVLKTSSEAIEEGTIVEYSTDNGVSWSTDYPTAKDFTNGATTVKVRAVNENFESPLEGEDYILNITKRPLVVYAQDTMEADGTTKTLKINEDNLVNGSVENEGLVEGEELTIDGAAISGKDAGTYTEVSDYTWKVTRSAIKTDDVLLLNNDDPTDSTDNYSMELAGKLTLTSNPDDPTPTDPSDNNNAGDGDNGTKTGDNTPIGILFGLLGVAAVGGGFAAFGRKKEQK